jgi:uncharacterized protein
VWDDLPAWMVVDGELYSLLGGFDGRRPSIRVLRDHARRYNKPAEVVERETEPVIEELVAQGILTVAGTHPESKPEPLSIANLTLNLTNRCNLRCPWCYNAGRTSDEMPVGELMDAIEAARGIFEPACSFILLGGEPFVDPGRLWIALDRAGSIFGPAPLVSTNGTLVTERVAAELAGRKVEVQVSLDSHDPGRHDAARGTGTCAKALQGTRRLVHEGVYTILSMVYTRHSLPDLEPYLELALNLGVAEARFIPLRLVGGGLGAREARPDQRVALLRRDFFSILFASCHYSVRRTSCGVGRRVVLIDADGAVYPCPNHTTTAFRAGSIAETGLAEIVHDSPVMRMVRERYQVSRYRRCRSCVFRHWCAGDCRGEVLALTGDPYASSPHCEELQQVYTQMLWLISEGKAPLGSPPPGQDRRTAVETFQ